MAFLFNGRLLVLTQLQNPNGEAMKFCGEKLIAILHEF